MSEETQIQSQASDEVQAEARKMGWQGPDKFRGDPDKFIDADEYIERGKTFIPFLNKDRERLNAELEVERQARVQLEATVRETREALQGLEERYTVESQKRTDAAMARLKTEISEARKAGDFDRMDQLLGMKEELEEAEAAAKAEQKKPAPAVTQAPPAVDPDMVAWASEHAWINTDKRKAALFIGFAEARRADGDTSVGRAFLDAALKDMEDALEREAPGKVASARNGSGDGATGTTARGKGYADLPADAKAACDADLSKFVGQGKKYKTPAEWRTAYANLYFE